MDDFVNPKSVNWPLHSSEQPEFDTVLTLGCILSNIPFNMVESGGFKLIINYLCPRANIKNATALAKYKLPMIYKNIENHVKEQLE